MILWMTEVLDHTVSAVVVEAAGLLGCWATEAVQTPGINPIGMTMLPQFVVSIGFILLVIFALTYWPWMGYMATAG